jgi:competence protein ComEA
MGLLSGRLWAMHRRAARPTVLEPGSLAFRVDLNRADGAQLRQLPGVGEALARRIEEYRSEHYGFRNVEELGQIPGIGPLTVERLRHLVYVEAPQGDEVQEVVSPARRGSLPGKKDTTFHAKPAGLKKQAALTEPVDINKASADELQRLPGIGPTLAGRIIEARKTTPFKSVDDLRRVSGIGPKTLDKLRPRVTVRQVTEAAAKKE